MAARTPHRRGSARKLTPRKRKSSGKTTAKASRKRNAAKRRTAKKSRAGTRYWSGEVTRKSNALDLESSVFKKGDPKAVARSLKRSADASHRRKSEPFRSAMSMLVFYINRAGKNLPESRLRVLEKAKDELRNLYHKPRHGS